MIKVVNKLLFQRVIRPPKALIDGEKSRSPNVLVRIFSDKYDQNYFS